MLVGMESIEREFITVVEALLDNQDCGYTLIRNGEYITGETIKIRHDKCKEIIPSSIDNELLDINNSGKHNTIIGIVPIEIIRYTGETGNEFVYLETLLNSLNKKGRLIILVPSNFLTAPYTEGIRDTVLKKYRINSIIQLPSNSLGEMNGAYIIDLENSRPQSPVSYYTKSTYKNLYTMCTAIKNKKPSFEVPTDMLTKRWDAQYLDPAYNDIRKKYLAKDTVRLGDISDVIPGVIIRPEERKEKGEYLILSPELIAEGKINYLDEHASYTEERIDDKRFSKAVLKDGDIVVCTSGKISFLIFHDEGEKVVIGELFCIIRSSEDIQKYIQVYLNTSLGEESFNLQAQMLNVGVGFRTQLTPSILASFVVPNLNTLKFSASMQGIKDLIERVALLFENEGWEVLKEYKGKNNRAYFDLVLQTKGKVVGVVEIRRKYPSDESRKRSVIELAEKALSIEGVQFFILFINDAMYSYKDHEFFRIPEIPTPDKYTQFELPVDTYIDNSDDPDIKEIPQGVASISDEYKILSLLSRIEKKIDTVQKTVDKISEQIQELSKQIHEYQDLTKRQLEYASDNTDEQEHIMKAFTDTCVERITQTIKSEYAIEQFEVEKKKLIDSMGEGAWMKMDEDAKSFLISSKVIYAKLVGISSIIDYSGVCLLVTKALELELSKRFCQNYVAYYKSMNSGQTGIMAAPITILNKQHNGYLRQNDFTLGSFPFIVGCKFVKGLNNSKKEIIKDSIIEYVKQGILKTYAESHNDYEILDLLSGYAHDIERVRTDYRNKAAHTNAVTKVSAKECFDLVLDVEKLLKRMLDSFDN